MTTWGPCWQEETRQEVLQTSFLFGLPALVGGFLLAFSFKRIALVELLTPVMLLLFSLTLLLINTTEICGVPKETMRQHQIFLILIIFLLFAFFMSASYLRSFITRTIYTMPVISLTMVNRLHHNDSINFAQAWVMTLFAVALMELNVYVNTKAKAKLFLKIKTTEQQQKQLADLLDAVPDNVFICSKAPGDTQVRGVYANFKMNNFFGRDVIH